MKTKIILAIAIVAIFFMSVGCIESNTSTNIQTTTQPTTQSAANPLDFLIVTNQRGYVDNVDWSHVVFTVTNTGNKNLEFIKVQISIYDENEVLLNTKTLYPSPYDDWGLPARESFDYETRFDPSNMSKFTVKIVSASFA